MTAGTGRDDAPIGTSGPSDDDDETALSWGGSRDNSYVEGPVVSRDDELDDDAVDDDVDDDELPEGVLSSVALVGHGLAAAVFLLYTVAWLKSISKVAPSFDSPLADWMWRVGTWFAVAAPAIWFVGTLLVVPTRRMSRRAIWFVVGVLLLIPWPFVIGNFG